ncbi:hypothetical protein [Actinomadura madurae]|uniref:hypothetical protein n=1 Tax=Actinomadura madurae TaxID=1993 RepID=UPI002026FDC9|nr:hypothetical protein [Actinomadura madurae]MCP9948935.1 hypothetical protein [Actinomadura madurae]MCP9965705.1 hypothetical protein [Actinomadura madurae]MCP9978177.1 hypothetical protein [Actinomadura madurae]MCQ0010302.1 hypothetical protein [Actinomadura madurae]MCQ0014383.1 hypothetical protein [Actinomadura madurae]
MTSATASYFAVLGGRALNLSVPLRDGTVGCAVVFSHRRRVRRAEASLVADDRGARAEAAVLLGTGGLILPSGRWQVGLAVRGTDGTERVIRVRAPAALADTGPALRESPCPDTGIAYTTSRSWRGHCVLSVRSGPPVAEVTRLSLSLTGADITGRLVGPPGEASGYLVFRPRDAGAVVTAEAVIRGDVFRATVPMQELADAAERVWDVWMCVRGVGELRVGRFLHDVRDPSRTFRVPARVACPAPGSLVALRPSYTATGGLSLACQEVPS